MHGDQRPARLLILIVAYQAESTIASVLARIPASIPGVAPEILILDDGSEDSTAQLAQATDAPYPVTVLRNPVNQGYGGNQKLGYHYAIAHGFDLVAMVHGDGQYAPERLPELVQPILRGEADAVLGTRMAEGTAALKGGMPLYKYVGNRVLTFLQNRITKAGLHEYHTGYRVYSVRALRRIAFARNTNDFHFDTEILLQFITHGLRIAEIPIPTHYGEEECRVNGLAYAWNVLRATAHWRIQSTGLLHDPKYERPDAGSPYEAKLDFPSTQSWVVDAVPAGARVLDVGCGPGHVARALAAKGCRVTGMDQHEPEDMGPFAHFVRQDLDEGLQQPPEPVDYVLLLDVIEHMKSPERLAEEIHRLATQNRDLRIIISTGNIAFFVNRLGLALGQFNYGPRGILDMTHTRLFTFASLTKLLRGAGFAIEKTVGIPAPYPLALGRGPLARMLLAINGGLIRVWRSLFSYQMLMVCRPVPALDWLLDDAVADTMKRLQARAPVKEAAPR